MVLTATTNAASPSYQWFNTSGSIPGATSSTLTVTAADTYYVVVTDGMSSCQGTSNSVVVTVNPLPTVSVTPTTATICQGGSTGRTATTNAASPTYQWFNTSGSIPGATSSTLAVTAADTYYVVVTDGISSCQGTSNSVVVTVNPLPTVSVTPTTATICQGGSTVLTATTNAASPTYQWFNTSGSIPGATSSTLTVTAADTYYVVVTDGISSCQGTSNSVVVTISPNPIASVTPSSATICQGGSTVLTAATNVASPTYQWFNTSGSIPGATSSTLTVTAADTYYVVVTDSISSCQGTSNSVIVTVSGDCQTQLSITLCCNSKVSCDGISAFTVNVKNIGSGTATGIIVTEQLPCCFDFLLGQGSGWTFTTEGKSVIATYSNPLPAGQTASFSITSKANCCCPLKNKVAITASAISDTTPTPVTACCITKITR